MERKKLGRGTYHLERADIKTGQSIKRKQASKENSHPREGRCQDWSEHGKKAS